MNLRHVVATSVDRDDLPDYGSIIFAEAIRALRRELPEAVVEVLTPDFNGDPEAIDRVLDAGPHVFSHNLETVRRLQPVIRRQAAYGRSLEVLRRAADRAQPPAVKSGLMLGFGESPGEVLEAVRDLVDAGCRILTLGQYLQPTRRNIEVREYVPPEVFEHLGDQARAMGMTAVAAGPMVRSSYRAEALYGEFLACHAAI
jgi:lipoic acid synthetase